MGDANEAMKALREWQKERAVAQDQALRLLVRSLARRTELDDERRQVEESCATALTELETSGLTLEQVAQLTGVEEVELRPRKASGRAPTTSSAK